MKRYLSCMIAASLLCSAPICARNKDKFSDKDAKNPQELKVLVNRSLPAVKGWCSREKAEAMMDLILREQPDTCVEIGVYGGSSIFPTAMALKFNKKGLVYAIDPWSNEECVKHTKGEDPNFVWWSKVDLEAVYKSFIKMLTRSKLLKFCKVMRMTSEAAAPQISGPIDILHIDGNHSEESAYQDAITYFPKVRSGGYIWFDDVDWLDSIQNKQTTRKAHEYLLKECDHVLSVDEGGCVLLKKR